VKKMIIKYGTSFIVYISLMYIYESYFYNASPYIPSLIFFVSILVIISLERLLNKK
jgi:hypothetical protein